MALLEQFQKALISRLRQPLETAGMDYATTTTPNPDLADALYYALKQSGYEPSTAFEVADADLDQISTDDYTKVMDLAELRLITTVVDNINQTDERLGPHGKWGSQYPLRLQRRSEKLQAKVTTVYGIDLGSLEVDVLPLMTNDISNVSS